MAGAISRDFERKAGRSSRKLSRLRITRNGKEKRCRFYIVEL